MPENFCKIYGLLITVYNVGSVYTVGRSLRLGIDNFLVPEFPKQYAENLTWVELAILSHMQEQCKTMWC